MFELADNEVKSDIQITDQAAQVINQLMIQEGLKGSGLRIGVKEGGCSGYSYYVSFDEEPSEADLTFESNGIRLFVDRMSFPHLQGMSLGYSTGLSGKGFEFRNPNAVKTCGCGRSFSD